MEKYDVIVVGAGPAGGQCARELSSQGLKVLLAERNRDFTVNSYSSAGAPDEIMHAFQLPETIIGSEWNKITIHSSEDAQTWESKQRRGVVLDFMKLRAFLAQEAQKNGATIKFGFSCQDYENQQDRIIATFKSQESKERHHIETKILVDATGGERHVLAQKLQFKANSFPSTGIEYLVQVPQEVYQKWAGSLSLFMGHAWMPQGYSWIFPMEQNKLKVGVGRYFQDDKYVPHQQSYTYYLKLLMEKCLGSTHFPILDKHGKTIHYTYGREDLHYDGNVIAIGDAVSTINPLAFEGIRHAMKGAHIASKHILEKLKGNVTAFEHYKTELDQHFGLSWKMSEMLMKFIYKEPKDKNIDLMVQAWRGLSFDQIFDIAFHYKLFPILKFLTRYTYLSAKNKIKTL